MAFKVNNKRQEDGSYMLSYGKGKKKLLSLMDKGDQGWTCDDLVTNVYPSMKNCKEAWGKWAEAHYGDVGKTDVGKAKGETAHPTSSGPPSFVPKPAAPTGGPPPFVPRTTTGRISGTGNVTEVSKKLEGQHTADPLDPRFRYGSDHPEESKRGKLTPLGLIVEIDAWRKRYQQRITDINQRLVEANKSPAHNPFYYVFEDVISLLERELGNHDQLAEQPTSADTPANYPTAPPSNNDSPGVGGGGSLEGIDDEVIPF